MRRHSFSSLSLCIFLFPLLVSACGGAGTRSPKTVGHPSFPSVTHCVTSGKTQTLQAISSLPRVQGEWPMFHGDSNRDGAITTGGGSVLSAAWSFCTGAPISSSPIVHAGTVYIGSTNGALTALDARTGKLIWQMQADSELLSTPIVQDGLLYIGSAGGLVSAVDATSGRVRWRRSVEEPGAWIYSSPAVANGLVVVGTASTTSEHPKVRGEVLALSAKTGELRWRTAMVPAGGGVWSSPALDLANGIVYVGTGDPDDGVQALALFDGHVLWHWRSVSIDLEDTDIGAGPLLSRDQEGKERLSVGGKDGWVYSLDAQKGQLLWKTSLGNAVFTPPAFAQNTIYAAALTQPGGVSWALNAQTGKPLWHQPLPAGPFSAPAIVGRTLYLDIGRTILGSNVGGIEVLDALTGKVLQYVDLHSAAESSPAVLSSWLFMGASNGNVYAFTR